MTDERKFDRKAACLIMAQAHQDFDRQAESDMTAAGGYRPVPFAGQPMYGEAELIALDAFLTKRNEGYPVRLAGDFARRFHAALTAHPQADRLALVTLENTKRFAVDADQLDLTTGYSSGSPVREALVVDARNLRARIAGMIDAAGLIVGERDEA